MKNPTQQIDVEKQLRGCTFPCGRQDIINAGRKNKAPREVLDRLNNLPDRQYNNVGDVDRELHQKD